MDITLPDVQSSTDKRNVAINRVGVRGITIPMQIQSIRGPIHTVAELDLFVWLDAEHRGTHMSRFVTLISEHKDVLSAETMANLLKEMLVLLESDSGYIEVRCPFFVTKSSPVSHLETLMNYKVRFIAERKNGVSRIVQEITAPVTSLCPCSREISEYGAHNQRSNIVIAVELNGAMSLEEQIRVAETSASCELWSRLKRNDEKYVTEYAYDHPKFVEDTVRDVACQLNADDRVVSYHIEVENFESIHNHSAYAMVERDKRNNG